ncbi:MAG: hypothetical protein U5K72_09315 [Balneolaceae bacterium]|nr:hypothetical protein [Balneolaceae bacterium]
MKLITNFFLCIVIIAMYACSENKNQDQASTNNQSQITPPTLEVMAADYAFQAPDTIQSGWTTLRLINNRGMEIHELGLAKLPDGKHLGDYMNEIMPAWETIIERLQDGEINASEIGSAAYEMLPEWNSDIDYVKSRGMISPGYTTENIMYLEPGTYMIECWVKDADGRIHISNGMIRELTVLDEANKATAPQAGYSISLTENGIETEESITEGRHVVGVDFALNEKDQLFYDDVHLIRTDNETDFTTINEWLGWYQVGGLRAPAPAEFLGGADVYGSLPYGEKAYFTVNIEPGEYAWVVHSPMGEPIFERFTIE